MASFDEPLKAYQQCLKLRHAELVQACLEQFIAQSNVDVSQNRATVKAIQHTETRCREVQSQLSTWRGVSVFLLVIGWVCAVGGVGLLVLKLANELSADVTLWVIGLLTGGIAAFSIRGFWLKQKLVGLEQELGELKVKLQALLESAWAQLRSLNACFTWNTVTDLLRETLPEVHFDRFWSQEQFEELVASTKWPLRLIGNLSVCDLQSGHICENPFAIVKGNSMRMGEKTYSGTRVVSVRKTRRGSDGKRISDTSFETLYAEITQPCPEYYTKSFVLFGSDAAPLLNFSRSPSKHSGKANTFLNRWAKKRTTKKLEAFSRNLDDEYGFTMMANREFETLFHAIDRSDECEFRLLFTPYSQHQMVELLNDTTIGYGDNFHMVKRASTTLLLPDHLEEANLSLNPSHFRHYDIDEIWRRFVTFNENYFKAFYFALAPIMTIPLYCQPRTRTEHRFTTAHLEISAWEAELIANACSVNNFEHPKSATQNILKTTVTWDGRMSHVEVIAHSFAAKKHTTYVSRHDSNGRSHQVPVEWIEYIPIQRTRKIIILPDASVDPQGPKSSTEAKNSLQLQGYTVEYCLHIRAAYVAFL